MKQYLVIEMETGTEDSAKSHALSELLRRSIPKWAAGDLDFEDDAVDITGDDEMFEKDFAINVYPRPDWNEEFRNG